MPRPITKAEWDAIRPSNSDQLTIEREGAYLYEIVTDDDGQEIAFATYRDGEATYTLTAEERL
jgi:hypothetical protein